MKKIIYALLALACVVGILVLTISLLSSKTPSNLGTSIAYITFLSVAGGCLFDEVVTNNK